MTSASPIDRLQSIRGFVFDLDGTLALGNRRMEGLTPLPGALEVLEHLNRTGRRSVIFTNGTIHAPRHLADSLMSAGFPITADNVMTPASVAAEIFHRRGYRRIMAFGGEGVVGPLREAGLEVFPPAGNPEVEAVFVGWYRECALEHIEAGIQAVLSGAQLFTASLSPFFATAHGKVVGASALICAAIQCATKVKATILGKPSAQAMRMACVKLGAASRHLAVVGDDPGLEMRMARRNGALAVFVGTGLIGKADLPGLPDGERPDLALDTVGELLPLLPTAPLDVDR